MTNQVNNHQFELWNGLVNPDGPFPGWTETWWWGAGVNAEVETSNPIQGTASFKLQPDSANGQRYRNTHFAVLPGEQYRVTGKLRTDRVLSGNSSNVGAVAAHLTTATTEAKISPHPAIFDTECVWHKVYEGNGATNVIVFQNIVTVPDGHFWASMVITGAPETSGSYVVWFDEVTVENVTDPIILQDYQYYYEGILWGQGTDIGVVEVDGLSSFTTRSTEKAFPRFHGSIPGQMYAEPKQITFKLRLDVGDSPSVETAMQSIKSSFVLRIENDVPLIFKHPDSPQKRIYCRPIDFPVIRSSSPGPHIMEIDVVFLAHDPREYSDLQRDEYLFGAVSGELDYPVDYPKDYVSISGEGETVIINDGNVRALPVFEVQATGGSMTGVELYNVTNGTSMIVNGSLALNQIMTIDVHAFITANGKDPIIINGTPQISAWQFPWEPIELDKGANQLQVIYLGNEGTTRIYWRDAWV